MSNLGPGVVARMHKCRKVCSTPHLTQIRYTAITLDSSSAPSFRTSFQQLGSKIGFILSINDCGNWVGVAGIQQLWVGFGRFHPFLPALSGNLLYIIFSRLCPLGPAPFFFSHRFAAVLDGCPLFLAYRLDLPSPRFGSCWNKMALSMRRLEPVWRHAHKPAWLTDFALTARGAALPLTVNIKCCGLSRVCCQHASKTRVVWSMHQRWCCLVV